MTEDQETKSPIEQLRENLSKLEGALNQGHASAYSDVLKAQYEAAVLHKEEAQQSIDLRKEQHDKYLVDSERDMAIREANAQRDQERHVLSLADMTSAIEHRGFLKKVILRDAWDADVRACVTGLLSQGEIALKGAWNRAVEHVTSVRGPRPEI